MSLCYYIMSRVTMNAGCGSVPPVSELENVRRSMIRSIKSFPLNQSVPWDTGSWGSLETYISCWGPLNLRCCREGERSRDSSLFLALQELEWLQPSANLAQTKESTFSQSACKMMELIAVVIVKVETIQIFKPKWTNQLQLWLSSMILQIQTPVHEVPQPLLWQRWPRR